MALRIAFDLDGVLANMEAALRVVYETRLGPAPSPTPQTMQAVPADGDESVDAQEADGQLTDVPAVQLNLTRRQERSLWREVAEIERFWEQLDEIEAGSVSRLAMLAREHSWEVIFLTKRPRTAGPTAQVQSQRWLEAKGFALPSVFVVQGSRGRIAAALDIDIVVDDRPENCLDVVMDSSARAILVLRSDTEAGAAPRLGIKIVNSFAECLDLLLEIDARHREKPGVIERVKKMFGGRHTPIRA